MVSSQLTDRRLDELDEQADALHRRIRDIETSQNIGVRYVQTQNGTIDRLRDEYSAVCREIRELAR